MCRYSFAFHAMFRTLSMISCHSFHLRDRQRTMSTFATNSQMNFIHGSKSALQTTQNW
uniref:Uncharacterized protein n=1 Tax=Rhizophora mucronata TaxID=61149 RepID=A0A2P2PIK3_RHIMU